MDGNIYRYSTKCTPGGIVILPESWRDLCPLKLLTLDIRLSATSLTLGLVDISDLILVIEQVGNIKITRDQPYDPFNSLIYLLDYMEENGNAIMENPKVIASIDSIIFDRNSYILPTSFNDNIFITITDALPSIKLDIRRINQTSIITRPYSISLTVKELNNN